ncbi:hypothetical protein RGRSB_0048 [cyanobacterium endosymbiont of Rhopalodia gibberula]|uniref:hypothetical protein n=1 Tax=cyanobacterium endosymbiont of Rhopalodia gibberula TaxID=1763363 RepID=UPI000DC73D6B|nr:hypothetical protein [cyanobacterium endosymbiont of Rhopalodia gibberula]BBA78684.1 hypothetical protein RGRSB_0048 [cyanobacterium endosymbiont of Rhopalodia gibberula]
MTTHFITAEVSLQENPLRLQKKIEAELKKQGEPLRWAITEVNTKKQTVYIEGIITNSNK